MYLASVLIIFVLIFSLDFILYAKFCFSLLYVWKKLNKFKKKKIIGNLKNNHNSMNILIQFLCFLCCCIVCIFTSSHPHSTCTASTSSPHPGCRRFIWWYDARTVDMRLGAGAERVLCCAANDRCSADATQGQYFHSK